MMKLVENLFKRSRNVFFPSIYFFSSFMVIMIIYFGNNSIPFTFSQELPTLNDPSLKLDLVADGLQSPTSMAFLTNNSLLITQKEGTLSMLDINNPKALESIVKLSNVNSKNERGLLGIAIDNNKSGGTSVLLYVTETGTQLDQDMQETTSNNDLRNRVYKYDWDVLEQKPANPRIILDLPAGPGTNHQGGKIKIGPDDQLYVVIGELQREGQLQNFREGPYPDDSGVLFRVNPVDGSPSHNNPFMEANNTNNTGINNPLAKYYAYGIRNSFGFDFDPITGKLWDTENGENLYDEINIVEPGFNSGWKLVMGPISKSEGITENDLVNFQGSHYTDPLLSWEQSRGVTDIEFFKSNNLGQKYENNIFVGDITRGILFFLQVNDNRNGLQFDNNPNIANDLIVSNEDEVSSITLGTGFKGITDILTGPDGNLYILTYSRADGGQGALYRISENAS